VDEGGNAAALLRLGHHLQRQRGFARRLRTVNFDHPAFRQTANTERDIEAQRARRDRLDLGDLRLSSELHDGTFAKRAVDLAEGGFEGFFAVHVVLRFDGAKGCTHFGSLLRVCRATLQLTANVPYLFSFFNVWLSDWYSYVIPDLFQTCSVSLLSPSPMYRLSTGESTDSRPHAAGADRDFQAV